MNFKEVETDQIDSKYLAYTYKDQFPGFQYKFPKGVKINNVQNNGLEFLNFQIDKPYQPQELNQAINQFFYLTQRSKTVDKMWLRILRQEKNDVEELDQISLEFHPTYKKILPRMRDICTTRGYYFHLRSGNFFKFGELIRSGVLVNQRQLTFKSTFRLPIENSSIKFSIIQDRLFSVNALPLKRIELSYHDLLKDDLIEDQKIKKALVYRVGNYQREKQFTIESGVGLGLLYNYKYHKSQEFIKTENSIGIVGKLWPKSGTSDLSLKYDGRFTFLLHKIWRSFLFCTQTFSSEYNFGSQASSSYMPGFKSFDKRNWRFYLTSDSKFVFPTSAYLMQNKIFPQISSTIGLFEDQLGKNFKASFGVGFHYQINDSQSINVSYNFLHYHQANDKPLSFEINVV